MWIDYRKLNSATQKGHFPLPFIDQILKCGVCHPFYCFLMGIKVSFHGIFWDILVHIDFERRIEVDKAKIVLISNLPTPKIVKDVQSFIGRVDFYKRFIQNFSLIS